MTTDPPRPLRVLHCLETVYSGGVEQTRLILARRLDPTRFRQRIVCTQALGAVPGQLRACGVEVDEIGVFRRGVLDPERYRRAVAVLRAFRPHLVHGAVFQGVATAMVAGTMAGAPVRIAEETSDPVDRSWRGDLLVRALYARADAVVAVSPAVTRYLQRIRVPDRKRVEILNGVSRPGIPDEAEQRRLREELGFAERNLVVGSVGRLLDSHKRVSDLIDAVALLADERVQLLVVGDGPDREALERQAQARGIAGRCRFVGYQGDLGRYYRLMDVFVLASAHEAFGLVLAEAMMADVAVIGTEVGGVPDVLDFGRAGRLVPPLQPAALAAALRDLLDDPEGRRRLAERGRIFAEARFGDARYAEEVAALYGRLAAARFRSF